MFFEAKILPDRGLPDRILVEVGYANNDGVLTSVR